MKQQECVEKFAVDLVEFAAGHTSPNCSWLVAPFDGSDVDYLVFCPKRLSFLDFEIHHIKVRTIGKKACGVIHA
jgi:hypothetical protein